MWRWNTEKAVKGGVGRGGGLEEVEGEVDEDKDFITKKWQFTFISCLCEGEHIGQ